MTSFYTSCSARLRVCVRAHVRARAKAAADAGGVAARAAALRRAADPVNEIQ